MSAPTQNSGRAWVFGDNVDTDQLAPGIYMKRPIEEMALHCLEVADPYFAGSVRQGDIVVGGRNFGMGSSREQAPQALRQLGVGAVLAPSFGGIFYRNALNLGLLALVCPEAGKSPPVISLRSNRSPARSTISAATKPTPANQSPRISRRWCGQGAW